MANYFCTDSVEEQVDLLTDKVTDLNTKKLDKAAVVQATGTGTDVVMSQKAVTDTINENLQTVNTELNGKLTKPTNPSAESAVTMLADGTVGTKPLSEIGGGGKLYSHVVLIENSDTYAIYVSIINNNSANITIDYIKSYLKDFTAVCYWSSTKGGVVAMEFNTYIQKYKIIGVLNNTQEDGVTYLNITADDNFYIIGQSLTEL